MIIASWAMKHLSKLWPVYLLAIITIFSYIQHLRNEELHSKIALLNAQISEYKVQSDQYNATILQWKTDYERQLEEKKKIEASYAKEQKQSIVASQSIMKADISKTCDGWIPWMIINAQHMSGK